MYCVPNKQCFINNYCLYVDKIKGWNGVTLLILYSMHFKEKAHILGDIFQFQNILNSSDDNASFIIQDMIIIIINVRHSNIITANDKQRRFTYQYL